MSRYDTYRIAAVNDIRLSENWTSGPAYVLTAAVPGDLQWAGIQESKESIHPSQVVHPLSEGCMFLDTAGDGDPP